MKIQEFIEILKSRSKFPFEFQVHSDKRIYIRIARENLKDMAILLFREMSGKFCIASGVHIREGFEVLYHFSFDKDKFICTIRTLAPHDDPKLDSLVSIIPASTWIEREIYDILGVQFVGHPNPKRLIKAEFVSENEFPFRKDFNTKKFREDHGLTPKISFIQPAEPAVKKPK